jgi:hypothetical protein
VFKNFFGKKNDGFYLQIEDDNAAPKPAAKAKAPAKPEPVAAPVAVVATANESIPVAPAATADKKAAKTDKKSAKKAEAPKAVAAPAPVAVSAPAAPAITNFATDYLIKPSSINSRRLPGANMRGFLDLARQVKKPVNIK